MLNGKDDEIEEEYGMPPGRLMYHLYHEREMSTTEIAEELGEPRSTVKNWLQRAGVKMRSRSLTDVQRILLIAYLAMGYGEKSAGDRVGCGRMTVTRYRKDLEATGEPVDIGHALDPAERKLLTEIIETHIIGDGDAPVDTQMKRDDALDGTLVAAKWCKQNDLDDLGDRLRDAHHEITTEHPAEDD